MRVMVPKMSDSRSVTYAARSYFDELLAADVEYEYGPRMLHSKALLVDDDFAMIGSANFDHRSFSLNFEVQIALFRESRRRRRARTPDRSRVRARTARARRPRAATAVRAPTRGAGAARLAPAVTAARLVGDWRPDARQRERPCRGCICCWR